MTDLKRNRRPAPPGPILREHYLKPRGITQVLFAEDIEVSEKHLSKLINGRVRLEPALAARIAKALGTSTQLWVNLQAAVDAWDAERAAADWHPRTVFRAPAFA